MQNKTSGFRFCMNNTHKKSSFFNFYCVNHIK
jgi:hypothetical protein